MDLLTASFSEISSYIKNKKISALEVTDFFLNRIELLDRKIHSYITINEQARDDAKKIDHKIAHGNANGLLIGVPFGIKDMLCTKGLKTTAGSKMLENFTPPYNATIVDRLIHQGAVVLGKLNQDEFAMGSSSETSRFGVTKNPWNTDYVPGGSSGGSAAAQASRLAAGTIGTDTGGSIRQPASFCGIVGVKPTYGRVSRYGIVAYASSLDQAGPMVSSVEDAAITLEVICGHDTMDSTSSQRSVPTFSKNLNGNIKGKRIGILRDLMSGLSADVEKSFNEAIEILKSEGAMIVDVSIPTSKHSIPVYYLIASSEASSNLSRYDGVKYGYRKDFKNLSLVDLDQFYSETRGEGFGDEVIRRIMLGTYCLSAGYYDAYYGKACQVRRLIQNEFLNAFKNCDAILSPVSATPAFKIGERISDPLSMYLNDIFTTSINLAGLPGMSVPMSLSSEKLPIGVQIISPHFDEMGMLNVGLAIEKNNKMKGHHPHVF